MEELLQTARQQDVFEWAGLVTGIAYVLLAAREKPVCWIFGIISCACIAYKDLTAYQLYADAGLQLFYVGMGIIGLYHWSRMENSSEDGSSIRLLSTRQHMGLLAAGVAVSFPLGFLLNTFTDAAFSYLDSLTTVFSVLATLLLIRKYMDNWIYWIMIDIAYAYLYLSRGGYFFGFLMIIYTVIAAYGLISWKKKLAQ